MADRGGNNNDEFNKQYGYQAMSNKVEQVDPRERRELLLRRQRDGATAGGEVETLRGRSNIGKMGDKVVASKKDEKEKETDNKSNKKKESTKRKDANNIDPTVKKQKKGTSSMMLSSNTGNVWENDNFLYHYQPSTVTSQNAYEQILSIIQSGDNVISNQDSSIMNDAIYEIIKTCRNSSTDDDKYSYISELLTGHKVTNKNKKNNLSRDIYTKLNQYCQQIDDFQDNDPTSKGHDDMKDKDDNDDDKINEDMGVAVVFDDDDDAGDDDKDKDNNSDSDNERIQNTVVDTDSSSEEEDNIDDNDDNEGKGEGKVQETDNNEIDTDVDDSDDEKPAIMLSRNVNSDQEDNNNVEVENDGKKKKKKNKIKKNNDRILSLHEIDSHYIQRQLSNYGTNYDPDEAVLKSNEILKILDITSGNTDLRECENLLLLLLGYDLYNYIKLLCSNRIRIWYMVQYKRSHTDEQRQALYNILFNESTGEGKRIINEMNMNLNSQQKQTSSSLLPQNQQPIIDDTKITTATATPAMDTSTSTTKNLDNNNNNDDMNMSMTKGKWDVFKKEEEGQQKLMSQYQPHEIDLELLAFSDNNNGNIYQTSSTKKCILPDTSFRIMKKGYEEVHVPAVTTSAAHTDELIHIENDLPKWTHSAFRGMKTLNRIQSKLCQVALYQSSDNILLCAPTGAGKTNVACLAILNILSQYMNPNYNPDEDDDDIEDVDIDNDEKNNKKDNKLRKMFNLNLFKIVYIAPMKALVQEVVKNFSDRLIHYGINVRELSGDSNLLRHEIHDTHMIVTTPEKWDIITRQGDARTYTQLVKLIIIDEIHLLHDDRGPVLESIIARTIRQIEITSEPVRLVGLSATLPNYYDVATLLRVKPSNGLYFFDHTYRPVPLQMQYMGITEKNALKRFQIQNDICYEKVIEQRNNNHQLLIFVHNRLETAKAAKAIRDLAIQNDMISSYFVKNNSATYEILNDEVQNVKNNDLKDLLPYGFAIHHAGMVREDRELVEDLFADRHIAVLCCTATLAWGVNLPAHAVIIRGTQIYNPTKGAWIELSPLDIMQMLGRAGRPQYDKEGEGIIITHHNQLQYYLSLTNIQLPIESQLIKTLPNNLNAEIVLGTIQSIQDGIDWLGYTFLYIRMIQNPTLYGISVEEAATDKTLYQRRLDLIHTACTLLEKSHLIKYDRKTGTISSTAFGKIASQYYITYQSMSIYLRNIRPNLSDIELIRLFALSGEFTHITVREEEKSELMKLSNRVPIPIKESYNESSAKINILLQSYISRFTLDGYALIADMVFIQQSASRIMRALFDIAIKKNYSHLAKLCLDYSIMISYRIWKSQSPLRQYKNIPDIVCRKLERKNDIDFNRYIDLTSNDLGELVGVTKMGRILHKLVHQFPRVELTAQIQPITRSMLRIELTIQPTFQYDILIHGYSQLFHLIVEDVNGEIILYYETFVIRAPRNTNTKNNSDEISQEAHVLNFTVPILEPLPPAYYVRVISDKWLHSTAAIPIIFTSMILPAKFAPPTELLDLQPLLPSVVIPEKTISNIFPFHEFNPIQTQTFHELYKTDRNCLICAPCHSGKTICAIFAILRMITTNYANGKCVYVAPTDDIADPTYEQFISLLDKVLPKGTIGRFTGETTPDLELLTKCKILVSSVKQWDMLSRRWKQRKAIHAVTLMIFDDLHFLGGELGPPYEIIISRTRFMNNQLLLSKSSSDNKSSSNSDRIRIVGLSASLANAKDVGEWMGVGIKNIFNFSPRARAVPLELYFQSFDQANYSARLMSMAKPVYNAIVRHTDNNDKSIIVYVPSKRQAQLTAIDIMTYAESAGYDPFVGGKLEKESSNDIIADAIKQIREQAMSQVLQFGIGFVHKGMIPRDYDTVMNLYNKGIIRILVCPTDLCWKIRCVAHLVIIMGTESYDGREGRHVDYPIVDILHMMSRHNITDNTACGKCVILCHSPKKEYLKKILYDPLPIESHLDSYLHDPLNSEIVTKTIANMQDAIDYITWTFLYRRLAKNPTYYGLRGTSNVFISEYLSEIIETVIGDLSESKCCTMSSTEDEDGGGVIAPLNLGMIAAYYYVQYSTIEMIAASVKAKSKIRDLLEILSQSYEFSSLPVRYGEDKTMKIMSNRLTHTLPDNALYDSNTKALILLQCHFSRTIVPSDMRDDQRVVLKESVNLIQAIVDVISSSGWLKPALATMELCQMVVQGLWNKDSIFKQIPHFNDEIVQRCQKYEGNDGEKIDSIFDILNLDDDVRNDLLQLPEEKMSDVATFCNNYPNIEVSFTVEDADNVTAGEAVRMVVNMKRDVDDEDDEDDEDGKDKSEDSIEQIGKVTAPLYPLDKNECWWIVVGDVGKNTLLSIKRVNNMKLQQKVVIDFLAPDDPGDYELTLFCMSDSYLGCDQEYNVPLSVAIPDSEDDDDDEEDADDSDDNEGGGDGKNQVASDEKAMPEKN